MQDALDYIKATVIEQKVIKVQGQSEAARYFNYPYNALEEALVNAVFHKLYREAEPVELSLIHISDPTRHVHISYSVFWM